MKFSKAKIALSVMLLASSIQANATVTGNTTATGSSVIVSLISADGTKASSFDIGQSFRTFDFYTSGQVANLSAGDYSSAWSSFTTGVGASLSSANFGIYGGTNFGGLSDVQFLTSINRDEHLGFSLNRAQAGNIVNHFSPYLDGLANQVNHSTAANGGSYILSSDTDNSEAFAGTYYDAAGLNIDYPSAPYALGVIGAGNTLDVYKVFNTPTTVGNTLMGTISLASDGALNYVAAVPEADTSLMMLSGIALMGFVARRRKFV